MNPIRDCWSCINYCFAFYREDDSEWPAPDKVGRQELEIRLGKNHISFTVRE